MPYGYSTDALRVDLSGNNVSLRPDYDQALHQVEFVNVGDAADQIFKVLTPQGALLAQGCVEFQAIYTLVDVAGREIWVELFQIDGALVGYSASSSLKPGGAYNLLSVTDVPTDIDTAPGLIAGQSFFGPGTHLMTTDGEVPIEWLATGDRLITRDHGVQPVLWVGRNKVNLSDMVGSPGLMPCAIAASTFGPDCPSHDTVLSRRHLVLLMGYQVELFAGVGEAFARVKHLVNEAEVSPALEQDQITYTQVLLAQHEVILANGLWVESLHLGAHLKAGENTKIPHRFLQDPSIKTGHAHTARLCLKRWEVTALMGAQHTQTLPALIRRVA